MRDPLMHPSPEKLPVSALRKLVPQLRAVVRRLRKNERARGRRPGSLPNKTLYKRMAVVCVLAQGKLVAIYRPPVGTSVGAARREIEAIIPTLRPGRTCEWPCIEQLSAALTPLGYITGSLDVCADVAEWPGV